MMIFPMYVIRNRATQSNEARARRDRYEPLVWHDDSQNLIQQDSSLAGQQSLLGVQGNETVQMPCWNEGGANVQAAVAVAAAVTVRQCAQMLRAGRKRAVPARQWQDLVLAVDDVAPRRACFGGHL